MMTRRRRSWNTTRALWVGLLMPFKHRALPARAVSALLLVVSVAAADAPWEKYHATYGKELRTALQGTIGVLTIGSLPNKQATGLQTYYQSGNDFEPYRKLGVLAATTPVSNFSYHPPMDFEQIGNFRYPVVDRCSTYLEIVYDPIENWRAWVDRRDLERDFHTEVVMLDSLATAEKGHYFLDIFPFTSDRKCRLYKAPSLDSGFTVISEDDTPGYLLAVLEVRGGLARVGNYLVNYENQLEAPKIVPLGWVRIWDDDGVLLVWIKQEDLC